MDDGTQPKPSTTKDEELKSTSSNTTLPKDPIVPSLMFLGVILATLSVIVAGYFHGNMNLITTLKNAATS